MEKIKKAFAKVPWGYLLFAMLFAVAGVLMIAFPLESVKYAVRAIGILTLIIFIVCVWRTLSERERSVRFFFNMLANVLALLCGGFMILDPDGALKYLFVVIGLLLIIDGAFKMQTSTLLRRYKIPAALGMLILSVCTIGLGFWLVRFTTPDEALEKLDVVLLGLALIVDALQNFLTMIVLPIVDSRRRQEGWSEVELIDKEKREREERLRAAKERRIARKAERKERNRIKKEAKREAKKAEKAAIAAATAAAAAAATTPAIAAAPAETPLEEGLRMTEEAPADKEAVPLTETEDIPEEKQTFVPEKEEEEDTRGTFLPD